MDTPVYGVGQAVFIRTDTPDFSEEMVPFKSIEELVQVCVTPRPNMTLDKVIIYAMAGGKPCAAMFSYVAATWGDGQAPPTFANYG